MGQGPQPTNAITGGSTRMSPPLTWSTSQEGDRLVASSRARGGTSCPYRVAPFRAYPGPVGASSPRFEAICVCPVDRSDHTIDPAEGGAAMMQVWEGNVIRIARPAMATAIGFAIGGAAIPQGEGAWAIGAIVGAGALGGAALGLGTRDVRGALPLALAGAGGMATAFGLAIVTSFAYERASTLAPWYLIAGLAPASVGTWLGVAKGEMRTALTLAAVR